MLRFLFRVASVCVVSDVLWCVAQRQQSTKAQNRETKKETNTEYGRQRVMKVEGVKTKERKRQKE